jgi:hypothetical protein
MEDSPAVSVNPNYLPRPTVQGGVGKLPRMLSAYRAFHELLGEVENRDVTPIACEYSEGPKFSGQGAAITGELSELWMARLRVLLVLEPATGIPRGAPRVLGGTRIQNDTKYVVYEKEGRRRMDIVLDKSMESADPLIVEAFQDKTTVRLSEVMFFYPSRLNWGVVSDTSSPGSAPLWWDGKVIELGDNDHVVRVTITSSGPVHCTWIKIGGDKQIEEASTKKYDDPNDLPIKIQQDLSVLAMALDGNLPGVGRKQGDHLYWIFTKGIEQ